MCNTLLLQLREAPAFALHLQLSGSFHLCCLVLSQHNKNRKQLEEQWLKQESQQLAAHDFLSWFAPWGGSYDYIIHNSELRKWLLGRPFCCWCVGWFIKNVSCNMADQCLQPLAYSFKSDKLENLTLFVQISRNLTGKAKWCSSLSHVEMTSGAVLHKLSFIY